jgi:hypothetical protein
MHHRCVAKKSAETRREYAVDVTTAMKSRRQWRYPPQKGNIISTKWPTPRSLRGPARFTFSVNCKLSGKSSSWMRWIRSSPYIFWHEVLYLEEPRENIFQLYFVEYQHYVILVISLPVQLPRHRLFGWSQSEVYSSIIYAPKYSWPRTRWEEQRACAVVIMYSSSLLWHLPSSSVRVTQHSVLNFSFSHM